MSMNPYDQGEDGQDMDYDNGMDVFYAPQSTFTHQPVCHCHSSIISRLTVGQLNYHLYTQPRPESLQHRYFISDNIREELQKRSEAVYTGPPAGLNLPEETQGYHSLMPLESTAGERRKFGNWYSTVYKAVNTADGLPYVLRRIESMLLPRPECCAV
jgi:PAB-dependent poly(A)-specific ribonuclease subunit 3